MIYQNKFIIQIVKINSIDRWKIYYRLQELKISSWCLQDGTLWVEINNCNNAVLLYSIVKNFISTNKELKKWLENCLYLSN